MELKDGMDTLKGMGPPQKVKNYKKHGVNNELYGVSIANLKKTKKDQNLSIKLWNTDNNKSRNK